MTNSVLIVGASVAGVGAVNELRRCGFTGSITLVDEQSHLPYDRPPLSKAALSAGSTDVHAFHDGAHYAERGVILRLGETVDRLDASQRTVRLRGGETLSADAVLIATGARARLFPAERAEGPVHTVRTLDDAVRLRAELRPGRRLAIIGGGFIGAEVASSAAAQGVEVALIEAQGLPLENVLGAEMAGRLASLHEAAGVRLFCGAAVDRIEAAFRAQRLILADGREIEADIVVAGLGALPNVEWLKGSGVALGDGVLCNEIGLTNCPGIYAAGDVAAWRNPVTGVHERHEHWTAAREQARIVAQRIAGAPESRWDAFVAYFWSDMHGKRVQLLGASRGADTAQIAFEDPEKDALVVEFHRDGTLIGVAGLAAAARTMRYAARLARPAAVEAVG
jgi:3-phenylpropionate/trans-cinnamate dioxygenase ferredoxin reductase subunit